MRLSRTRGAVVAATIAAVTAIGIVPASADVPHRGVNGCFAYSWAPGWFTTTLYWHNRCSTRHRIEVVWDGQIYNPTVRLVNGYAKGNAWAADDGVTGVYDLGRA